MFDKPYCLVWEGMKYNIECESKSTYLVLQKVKLQKVIHQQMVLTVMLKTGAFICLTTLLAFLGNILKANPYP